MSALGRLAFGLLLAAGLAGFAQAQAPTPFDGQYMGELTLTGTLGGDCTTPPLGSLYPLAITNGEVKFAYLPRFNTTLRGNVAKNGTFKATARAKNGKTIQMTGRVQGFRVTATIDSPSCRYNFQTKE